VADYNIQPYSRNMAGAAPMSSLSKYVTAASANMGPPGGLQTAAQADLVQRSLSQMRAQAGLERSLLGAQMDSRDKLMALNNAMSQDRTSNHYAQAMSQIRMQEEMRRRETWSPLNVAATGLNVTQGLANAAGLFGQRMLEDSTVTDDEVERLRGIYNDSRTLAGDIQVPDARPEDVPSIHFDVIRKTNHDSRIQPAPLPRTPENFEAWMERRGLSNMDGTWHRNNDGYKIGKALDAFNRKVGKFLAPVRYEREMRGMYREMHDKAMKGMETPEERIERFRIKRELLEGQLDYWGRVRDRFRPGTYSSMVVSNMDADYAYDDLIDAFDLGGY
jgi:hypothetical protein